MKVPQNLLSFSDLDVVRFEPVVPEESRRPVRRAAAGFERFEIESMAQNSLAELQRKSEEGCACFRRADGLDFDRLSHNVAFFFDAAYMLSIDYQLPVKGG